MANTGRDPRRRFTETSMPGVGVRPPSARLEQSSTRPAPPLAAAKAEAAKKAEEKYAEEKTKKAAEKRARVCARRTREIQEFHARKEADPEFQDLSRKVNRLENKKQDIAEFKPRKKTFRKV